MRIKLLEPQTSQALQSTAAIPNIAAALKEALENSLDASSSSIQANVDTQAWEVVVQDDGLGVEPSDASKLAMSGATSKASDGINYGFRGRALASVSDLANVTISSRSRSCLNGFELSVRNRGTSRELRSGVAMPLGTKVVMQDLFHPFPIRRRRLAMASQEVKRTFQALAVVNNRVEMTLILDGRLVFNVPPGSIAYRASLLFPHEASGTSVATTIRSIDLARGNFRVVGCFARHRPQGKLQMLFVNGRLQGKDSPAHTYIVTLLTPGRRRLGRAGSHGAEQTPMFVCDIQCHSKLVKNTALASCLDDELAHILETVFEQAHVRRTSSYTESRGTLESMWNDRLRSGGVRNVTKRNIRELEGSEQQRHEPADFWAKRLIASWENPALPLAHLDSGTQEPLWKLDDNPFRAASGAFSLAKSDIPRLRVLGQLDRKYILCYLPNPSIVIAFDQHAVDERIRLEYLENHLSQPSSTLFDFPIKALPATVLPGFLTEGSSVRRVPRVLLDRIQADPGLVKRVFCSDQPKNALARELHTVACRSAIMFGDELTVGECATAMIQLGECRFPFICAHGRPSLVPLARLEQAESPYGHVLTKRREKLQSYRRA